MTLSYNMKRLTSKNFVSALIMLTVQTAICENSTCSEFNCIDQLCSDHGLCTTGCVQWFTVSTVNVELGYNCSVFIPEFNSSADFYISNYDDKSVKFYIEMDTQIPIDLIEYYRYSIEQSIRHNEDGGYDIVLSGIRHRHNAYKIITVKLKLEKDTPHWFRLRLQRKENGLTSGGEPSHAVGLYITTKQQQSQQKVDDKIIPLVVLLTIFVAATITLGVLANYLARKRAEAKESQGVAMRITLDETASNASVLSEQSDNGVDGRNLRTPVTPTSLRYQQCDGQNTIANNEAIRGNSSVPDFLKPEDSNLQSSWRLNGELEAPTPLPQVEDSPFVTRLNLDDSYTSAHSDISGRNVQVSIQDICMDTSPTKYVK